MSIGLRRAARLVAAAFFFLESGIVPAASVAELTALASRSTFEVVLPKNEPAHVSYEKPLPLELLPFAERNDRFWSIGTAFAITPDLFVSNAHVLTASLGSPLAQPHLRDADGKTYPVERVVKFSLHEDFIVFRAKGAPAATPLPAERQVAVGARVFAVGNALGEGVVVRDGLLTSMTPEEQDGRWRWLRFSAAASPGNSGGPLLDEEGRVVGVVTARSAGENLNYALPISLVLDGSERAATIDVRSSFGLPVLRQQMVAEFKDEFRLPAPWADFSRQLQDAGDRQYKANEQKLLELHAGDLPPAARSGRLLAELDRESYLAFIAQQTDDSWGLTGPTGVEDTDLDGATLRTGRFGGTITYQFFQDDDVSDPEVHRDGKAFMDRLLKGIGLPRVIGTQAVRVTSLGKPAGESLHADRFGRIWQQREWALGFADLNVVTLTLPTPDGYVGLLQLTSAAGQVATVAGLRLMADYVHAIYDGSVRHWEHFLARKELVPSFLRDLQFGKQEATVLSLPRLDVNVDGSLLALTPESTLSVFTGYDARDGRLIARPAGFFVQLAPDDEDSWFGVLAQVRPGSDAGQDVQRRWRQMGARTGEFDGRPKSEQDRSRFWAAGVLGDPEGDIQYELIVSLKERSLTPRQVAERFELLKSGLHLHTEDR